MLALSLSLIHIYAAIVLGANLHVTAEKASGSSIYNNDRINALNRDIKSMAEASGYVYLDVNQVFDDENGNLAAGYSSDGAHVLGKDVYKRQPHAHHAHRDR